jgi:hypothetical protein
MIEKVCRRCGESKPLTDYYKHKNMYDGHLNICKECTKKRVRKHREKNIESIRAYDRQRAKKPHRKKNNISNTKKARARNELYTKAHNKVIRGVEKGIIKKTGCVFCGRPDSHGHHFDYTRPLDVVWLCPIHHRKVHAFMALYGD